MKILKKFFAKEQRFPFQTNLVCTNDTSINASFIVNSPIEEYRISKWGGEQNYVESMLKELRSDDILYDIGSSIGLISVLSARICSNGKIISFEPDPENARNLKTNFDINNFKNYEIHQIAVGEKDGFSQLFTNGSNDKSPSLHPVNNISNNITVTVRSIDSMIRNNELLPPTVIKIDIEGAELLALMGMKELLLSNHKPRLIFLEIHPDFLEPFGHEITDIFKFIINNKYKFDNLIQRDEQILCNLIQDKN